MAKRSKTWARDPAKPPTAKVPDAVKADLSSKAQELIDQHLKPTHIKPPPNKAAFNNWRKRSFSSKIVAVELFGDSGRQRGGLLGLEGQSSDQSQARRSPKW